MTQLWSLQSPSFDLTLKSGKVDHLRSCFYQMDERIQNAYHELWQRIGQVNGQIIWCCTIHAFRKTGIAKRLWSIEVEDAEIICRIDDVAWNRIIGRDFGIPPDMKHLMGELDRKAKSGNWWDELIVNAPESGYFRSAIIRYPVSDMAVKSVVNWEATERGDK